MSSWLLSFVNTRRGEYEEQYADADTDDERALHLALEALERRAADLVTSGVLPPDVGAPLQTFMPGDALDVKVRELLSYRIVHHRLEFDIAEDVCERLAGVDKRVTAVYTPDACSSRLRTVAGGARVLSEGDHTVSRQHQSLLRGVRVPDRRCIQRTLRVSAAMVLFLAPDLFGAQESARMEGSAAPQTRVVMLGTGTPGPSPERSGPATAIVVNGTAYLVDIGPGVVRRAAAAAARHHLAALQPTALHVVFVTHLHSDHTVGYPDLIFTPWVVGRRVPLEVFGPPGLRAMTDHVLAAWADDIRIRNEGLERGFPEHSQSGYQVVVHEIAQPGVVYRDSNITVTAFAVKHGEWKYAYGYRFDTPDRSIVITGDTSPTDATVDACNGCDLLIHEVYTEKGYAAASQAWQNYRQKYHTSTRQLAELAGRARPKLLVLYHQMYQFNTSIEADLIEEMRRFYKGRFSSSKDLDIY